MISLNKTIKNYFITYNCFCNWKEVILSAFNKLSSSSNDEILFLDATFISKDKILDLQNILSKKTDFVKFIIIFNAEKLNKEVVNAFLLFLEENQTAYFVFLTKNEHLVLSTLKSRCIKMNLVFDQLGFNKILKKYNRLNTNEIEFLKFNFDNEEDINIFFQTYYNFFLEFKDYLIKKDLLNYMKILNWLKSTQSKNIYLFLVYLQYCSNDLNQNQMQQLNDLIVNYFDYASKQLLLNNLILIFGN